MCASTTYYGGIHKWVKWVEEKSGIDITPCFDADGKWAPSETCKDFPDPEAGGSWNQCDAGMLSGWSHVCGDNPHDKGKKDDKDGEGDKDDKNDKNDKDDKDDKGDSSGKDGDSGSDDTKGDPDSKDSDSSTDEDSKDNDSSNDDSESSENSDQSDTEGDDDDDDDAEDSSQEKDDSLKAGQAKDPKRKGCALGTEVDPRWGLLLAGLAWGFGWRQRRRRPST